MNMPPGGGGGSFIMMTYNTGANTANTNSGLSGTYFANGALTFPLSDSVGSVGFAVSLQGPTLGKDLNVTLNVDNSRLADNFANDGLVYLPMPDSVYSFSSNQGVVKAGTTFAPFQLTVFPNKIDGSQNYMLPVTATNDGGLKIADNYQTIYIHTIGNPLAGSYNWAFRRHDCSDSTTCALNTGSSWNFGDNGNATFAPINGTSFNVPIGYYVQPNVTVSFVNTNGVLSNFKAFFSQDVIDNTFTANGITVTVNPTIQVSSDYKRFEIHYVVFNGTNYRNCLDIYQK